MLDIKSGSIQQVPFWGQNVELKTKRLINQSNLFLIIILCMSLFSSCVENSENLPLKFNNHSESIETATGVTLNFSGFRKI